MVLQSDQAFAAWVQSPKPMDNFAILNLEQVKRWIKIKSRGRKIVCMCVGTQNFKINPLKQSHFKQKEEENEFGNEINNGDLKHLLQKKKVMFTKCHIDCPEDLIPLRSMHKQ